MSISDKAIPMGALIGINALTTGCYPMDHALAETSGGFRYTCECGVKVEGISAWGEHLLAAYEQRLERRA